MNIVIAGAGSIGCYVGGLLALAGRDVRFLARPRIVEAVTENGLTLTDYNGLDSTQHGLAFSREPSVLENADIILVTVKSAGTADMARLIAQHAPQSAIVMSLQNGVTNAATLRAHLPNHDVRATMVPFNVVPTGKAQFHRGTSGDILTQHGALPDLNSAYLRWAAVDNIEAVQWGKLLINLGNGLNALSDLPLLEMLQDKAWRKLMADQMGEALNVLKQNGISPAKTTAAPVGLLPHILRLPTPLFKRIAAQMLTIDPQARSSMWDDLTQRRQTEVDALQGVILDMAQHSDTSASLCAAVSALIKQAEAAQNGPPGLTPAQILSHMSG